MFNTTSEKTVCTKDTAPVAPVPICLSCILDCFTLESLDVGFGWH